jgi:hypothetical protein
MNPKKSRKPFNKTTEDKATEGMTPEQKALFQAQAALDEERKLIKAKRGNGSNHEAYLELSLKVAQNDLRRTQGLAPVYLPVS